MELSPTIKAANCAVAQEIPNILQNPNVHYRFQKSSPLIPTMRPMKPVQNNPSDLSKTQFNVIHPPTSWSS
jgi:hypothetical protein